MQKYNRVNEYFADYWYILYTFYSKHGQAFLVTYYNIDVENTVWDNENLMGGYYEKIGELSGVRWKKILTFPVFFIEETESNFDAQEIGLVLESKTGFVFPSSYGITPYPNDIIKLYQNYLQEDDTYSLYTITGRQKQTPGDKTFWKCSCSVEQSRTINEIEPQVTDTLVFFDYDKKIHTLEESVTMTKLLSKNETIRSNLNNNFDQNSGLYFV